jgi:hypothetical protein
VPDPASALPEVADGQAGELEAPGLELHAPQLIVGPALMLVALGGQPAKLL